MGKIHGNKTLLEVLGLRDISKPLYNKTLEFIYKYDVIRGIRLDKEIIRNGERLYHFEAVEYGLGGLIYPLDEIVHVNRMCDIIIHNWKKRTNPIKIDAQIYHDCKRGERISVKISRKSFGEEPSFKIFNLISKKSIS